MVHLGENSLYTNRRPRRHRHPPRTVAPIRSATRSDTIRAWQSPGSNTEPTMYRAICLITLAWTSAVNAQAPGTSEIPLYNGAAPGSERWDWEEKSVTRPNGMPI